MWLIYVSLGNATGASCSALDRNLRRQNYFTLVTCSQKTFWVDKKIFINYIIIIYLFILVYAAHTQPIHDKSVSSLRNSFRLNQFLANFYCLRFLFQFDRILVQMFSVPSA